MIGLIAALDKEIELIRDRMDVSAKVQVYGSDFYVGSYDNRQIIAGCCSVGTINAAVCASTLIREWRAKRMINIGIAGSLSRELSVLDVVLSQSVEFHDTDSDILAKYYPHRKAFPADGEMVEACSGLLQQEQQNFRVGKIVSGDSFVNTAAQKQAILANYPDALCVEMEGAAIGQVALMNNTPFLVIRTISDLADDEADISYDEFIEQAAHKSAGLALQLIEQL